jgi:hypothetical protein
MTYTNHSGGAKGADSTWDFIGRQYGVEDHRHYWHDGLNKPRLGNVLITSAQLEEGWEKVKLANKTLQRRPEKYKSLLSRNWFQVKNSLAVFAIGSITEDLREVQGGTGWAVQMAIDASRAVYVFDQEKKKWFEWQDSLPGAPGFFVPCDVPVLTQNFAGVGTREITQDGVNAIREVYKKTFQK